MTPTSGSYVLLLRLPADRRIEIGQRRGYEFVAGNYLYCGSALGPGGLESRLARHCRTRKRLRWHIDYFLPHATMEAIWVLIGDTRLECIAASSLQKMGCVPIRDFGSSDCRCRGHLLYSPTPLDRTLFDAAMQESLPAAPPAQVWPPHCG